MPVARAEQESWTPHALARASRLNPECDAIPQAALARGMMKPGPARWAYVEVGNPAPCSGGHVVASADRIVALPQPFRQTRISFGGVRTRSHLCRRGPCGRHGRRVMSAATVVVHRWRIRIEARPRPTYPLAQTVGEWFLCWMLQRPQHRRSVYNAPVKTRTFGACNRPRSQSQ